MVMVDYKAIEETVKRQLTANFSDSDPANKIAGTIIDIAIKATISTLKEYEKQRSIKD